MFNAGEKINLCLQSIYNQQITPPRSYHVDAQSSLA